MTLTDDQDWIKRAQQGDAESIAELYKQYWRAARAVAYGVVGDYSLAEDAACEAFAAAMQGLKGLQDPRKFGPWLRTIVIRTAQCMKTAKPPRTGLEPEQFADVDASSPGTELEQREIAALVHKAVANLSETLREAISLHYFEGYTLRDAARFLDVPQGTLKRRLHEGRQRLRETGEKILQGRKTMDPKRQRIVQELRELASDKGDRKKFGQIMSKAMWLRPMPYDLMRAALKRHSKVAEKMATPEGRTEMQKRMQAIIAYAGRPSARALDPDHAVGQVVGAIKRALPGFHQWIRDDSLMAHTMLQVMSGEKITSDLPPGFAEGRPAAFYYLSKGSLFPAEDGSLHTFAGYMKGRDMEAHAGIMYKGRFSDTMVLQWMQLETIELHAVEDMLTGLARGVVPQAATHISPYEEPRYRAALRLDLDTIPVPAALGGPLAPWPDMPEGFSMGLVQVFLEAWAWAQTGEALELEEVAPMLDAITQRKYP